MQKNPRAARNREKQRRSSTFCIAADVCRSGWHLATQLLLNRNMPIYEFACPRCRVIFNFLSKRVQPDRSPTCPKCGNRRLVKQVSRFAAPRRRPQTPGDEEAGDDISTPDFDDPGVARVMSELERDMEHLDEHNPKHMAHMMRKMKQIMPPGMIPKEMEVAIKRLEAGEDPEKIEQDMGDLLGDFMGGPGREGGPGYTHDTGLYDY